MLKSRIEDYPVIVLIRRLAAIGYEVPPGVDAIIDAADATPTAAGTIVAAQEAMRTAVLSADTEGIRRAAELRAAAEASDSRGQPAFDIARQSALAAGAQAVLDLVGADLWEFIRDAFNSAGKRFADALERVDPDADPRAVALSGSKATREAWAHFPEAITELDSLADILRETYRVVVGRRISKGRAASGEYLGLIAHAADDPGAVIAAWLSGDVGRGGQWAEIARLTALGAPPTPDAYEALSAPATAADVEEPPPAPAEALSA